MSRLLLLTLLLVPPALGQADTSATPCSTKIQYAPISGRVLDAIDGHPLAGAMIRYRGVGEGGEFDNGHQIPPTVEGVVKTSPNGNFTLPDLGPGELDVRVAATGYLGAHDRLAAQPVGYKTPPGFPLPPDGVFRLQPDTLGLKSMSAAALANFALPAHGYDRHYIAAGFTPDGGHLGFITADREGRVGQPPAERCVAWTYDLTTGLLYETNVPSKYCALPSTEIAWDDDFVYIHWTDYNTPSPLNTPSPFKEELIRLQDGETTILPVADLPKAFRERLARDAANKIADVEAEGEYDNTEVTTDRQYLIKFGQGEGRQCSSLIASSKQSQWSQTLDTCSSPGSFPNNYVLDRDHDLLFFIQFRSLAHQHDSFEKLRAFNLKTRGLRSFPLPASRPELLTEQWLQDGAIRIAYSVQGDCDPGTSDYVQSHTEVDEQGIVHSQSSLCFITIPPEVGGSGFQRN